MHSTSKECFHIVVMLPAAALASLVLFPGLGALGVLGGGREGKKSPSATIRKFLKGCRVTVAYACLSEHPSLRTKKINHDSKNTLLL